MVAKGRTTKKPRSMLCLGYSLVAVEVETFLETVRPHATVVRFSGSALYLCFGYNSGAHE